MTPEGKFKKKVCAQLRKWGCTVIQYEQNSTTIKGFPDTIVLLPESLTIFIEFKKSKTAKFRPLQKEWIKKLNDRSYFAYVMYPENEKEIMAEIRNLL
jgi:hypothetical protein